MTPFPSHFFARDTVAVARDMIGVLLVRELPDGPRLAGRIVETEAYTRDDPAMHGWKPVSGDEGLVVPEGRAVDFFGPPGTAYVYLTYFTNWLLNVVTEPEGEPGAVLIRAVEPVEGIETMRANRPTARRDRDLASGPSRLTQAFGIASGEWHRADLTRPPLYFAEPPAGRAVARLAASCRIGLSKGVERPYRFYEEGNPHVSPGVPSDVRLARKKARG